MLTELLADGSLLLDSGTESRLIRPGHAAHAKLLQLYHSHAEPVSLSAAAAPESAQFETGGPNEEWEPYRLSSAPGYGGFVWKNGTPDLDEVYEVPVEYIASDPAQFRSSDNPGILGDFDPEQCGVLAVWKSPDGRTLVIDGHRRLNLACHDSIPALPCQYIGAKTAAEARAAGMRLNGVPEAEITLALSAAAKPDGPIAAGLAVMAQDTGRVLMIQRAISEGDRNGGKWEIAGGHIERGEEPEQAALREWQEEVGLPLPGSPVSLPSWDASNGKYRCFILQIPSEDDLDLYERDTSINPDGDNFEAVAWVAPKDMANHNLRKELLADLPRVRRALNKARKVEPLEATGKESLQVQTSDPVMPEEGITTPSDGEDDVPDQYEPLAEVQNAVEAIAGAPEGDARMETLEKIPEQTREAAAEQLAKDAALLDPDRFQKPSDSYPDSPLALAEFYANWWNDAGLTPEDIGDEELAVVHAELGDGASLDWDGTWWEAGVVGEEYELSATALAEHRDDLAALLADLGLEPEAAQAEIEAAALAIGEDHDG